MPSTRVGIQEFRDHLASYLVSRQPVAVTHNGETIGIYIPTHRQPDPDRLDALVTVAEQVHSEIAAAGTTEDEILADFKKARRSGQKAS